MSGFTKKDQDKSLFTVKKDAQGNTVVMRASGENGGEIRGSVLRTNQAKPFLVPGKGIKINSGSKSEGYPGPGQIELAVNASEIAADIQAIVAKLGITGTAGPRGATGATGAQGAPGEPGEQGPAGPPGANGTNGTNGTNGSDGEDGTDGADGLGLAPGDYYSFNNDFKILNDSISYPIVPPSGSTGLFGSGFGETLLFSSDPGWAPGDFGDPPRQQFSIGYTTYNGSAHDLSTLNKDLRYSVTYTHHVQDNNVANILFECDWFIKAVQIGDNIGDTPVTTHSGVSNFQGFNTVAQAEWQYNQASFDPSPATGPAGSNPGEKYLVLLCIDIQGTIADQSEGYTSELTVNIADAGIQTKYTVP